jgi:hypothetical protein
MISLSLQGKLTLLKHLLLPTSWIISTMQRQFMLTKCEIGVTCHTIGHHSFGDGC